eukprot:TRINITY_DN39635_c0_g1_i1.p1 TRINITY_DN39635_c0_g1~~TRINITY_DN39635_c0_g1_i1.p1  ORF type:complete len:1266 (+),score=395.17 TRINITY_DN39635_c0_g1_i1:55-3852(+)
MGYFRRASRQPGAGAIDYRGAPPAQIAEAAAAARGERQLAQPAPSPKPSLSRAPALRAVLSGAAVGTDPDVFTVERLFPFELRHRSELYNQFSNSFRLRFYHKELPQFVDCVDLSRQFLSDYRRSSVRFGSQLRHFLRRVRTVQRAWRGFVWRRDRMLQSILHAWNTRLASVRGDLVRSIEDRDEFLRKVAYHNLYLPPTLRAERTTDRMHRRVIETLAERTIQMESVCEAYLTRKAEYLRRYRRWAAGRKRAREKARKEGGGRDWMLAAEDPGIRELLQMLPQELPQIQAPVFRLSAASVDFSALFERYKQLKGFYEAERVLSSLDSLSSRSHEDDGRRVSETEEKLLREAPARERLPPERCPKVSFYLILVPANSASAGSPPASVSGSPSKKKGQAVGCIESRMMWTNDRNAYYSAELRRHTREQAKRKKSVEVAQQRRRSTRADWMADVVLHGDDDGGDAQTGGTAQPASRRHRRRSTGRRASLANPEDLEDTTKGLYPGGDARSAGGVQFRFAGGPAERFLAEMEEGEREARMTERRQVLSSRTHRRSSATWLPPQASSLFAAPDSPCSEASPELGYLPPRRARQPVSLSPLSSPCEEEPVVRPRDPEPPPIIPEVLMSPVATKSVMQSAQGPVSVAVAKARRRRARLRSRQRSSSPKGSDGNGGSPDGTAGSSKRSGRWGAARKTNLWSSKEANKEHDDIVFVVSILDETVRSEVSGHAAPQGREAEAARRLWRWCGRRATPAAALHALHRPSRKDEQIHKGADGLLTVLPPTDPGQGPPSPASPSPTSPASPYRRLPLSPRRPARASGLLAVCMTTHKVHPGLTALLLAGGVVDAEALEEGEESSERTGSGQVDTETACDRNTAEQVLERWQKFAGQEAESDSSWSSSSEVVQGMGQWSQVSRADAQRLGLVSSDGEDGPASAGQLRHKGKGRRMGPDADCVQRADRASKRVLQRICARTERDLQRYDRLFIDAAQTTDRKIARLRALRQQQQQPELSPPAHSEVVFLSVDGGSAVGPDASASSERRAAGRRLTSRPAERRMTGRPHSALLLTGQRSSERRVTSHFTGQHSAGRRVTHVGEQRSAEDLQLPTEQTLHLPEQRGSGRRVTSHHTGQSGTERDATPHLAEQHSAEDPGAGSTEQTPQAACPPPPAAELPKPKRDGHASAILRASLSLTKRRAPVPVRPSTAEPKKPPEEPQASRARDLLLELSRGGAIGPVPDVSWCVPVTPVSQARAEEQPSLQYMSCWTGRAGRRRRHV